MKPKWLTDIEDHLTETEIQYILNGDMHFGEEMRQESFDAHKKCMCLLKLVNEENAGLYVSKKFSFFRDYLHEEWIKHYPDSENLEFREVIEKYTSTKLEADEEIPEREKYVREQESKIMTRISKEASKNGATNDEEDELDIFNTGV